MVVHATNLLVHRRLMDDVVRYRDSADLFVLSPPCPVRVQPMDFSQAKSLIERSLDENRRLLDRYADTEFIWIEQRVGNSLPTRNEWLATREPVVVTQKGVLS